MRLTTHHAHALTFQLSPVKTIDYDVNQFLSLSSCFVTSVAVVAECTNNSLPLATLYLLLFSEIEKRQ